MRFNVKNLSDGELVELRNAAAAEYDERVSHINTRRAVLTAPMNGTNGSPARVGHFRNPTDPKQTWSGKGRRPFWYLKAIKSGVKPEAMRA